MNNNKISWTKTTLINIWQNICKKVYMIKLCQNYSDRSFNYIFIT